MVVQSRAKTYWKYNSARMGPSEEWSGAGSSCLMKARILTAFQNSHLHYHLCALFCDLLVRALAGGSAQPMEWLKGLWRDLCRPLQCLGQSGANMPRDTYQTAWNVKGRNCHQVRAMTLERIPRQELCLELGRLSHYQTDVEELLFSC